MSETIKEKVELFDKKFPELTSAWDKATESFHKEFMNTYYDMLPIIDVMKKHSVYFTHPDLPDNIRSPHGPIIARNRFNASEIFVLIDDVQVCSVRAHDGEINEDERIMILGDLVSRLDHKFAWKGLQSLHSRLDVVLSSEAECIAVLADLTTEIQRSRA